MTMIGTEPRCSRRSSTYLAGLGYRPVDRKEMSSLRAGRMGEPSGRAFARRRAPQAERRPLRDRRTAGGRPAPSLADSESFLGLLRDGIDVLLDPEQGSRHITVVDWLQPGRNDYVVTAEMELKTGAQREPRLDVVAW